MLIRMDITQVSDSVFKIKGKTAFALADPKGPTIESISGDRSKSFNGAGEYEVAGISIIGIKVDETVVYVYEVDSLRICHLGLLTDKLPENKLSQIGDVDILILPVCNKSIELMQQLESYYVIPFGQKDNEELEKFLKESGLVVEKLNKFGIKKEELIEDSSAQIVVLTKS